MLIKRHDVGGGGSVFAGVVARLTAALRPSGWLLVDEPT